MSDPVQGQFYFTREQVVDIVLSSLAADAARKGLEINVLEGSENEWRANAFATFATVAFSNNRLSGDALSPLTATGSNLIDNSAAWGVTERPASASTGKLYVRALAPGTQTIPSGFVGTFPDGTKFETVGSHDVTAAASSFGGYAITAGNPISIRTRTTGENSAQAPATKGTWDSPSLGILSRTCVVGLGGVTGGRDADTPEVIRQRWIRKLNRPGGPGNSADLAEWAEEANSSVVTAYVYPNLFGPGSSSIALEGDPAEDDGVVSDVVVNDVAAFVAAKTGGRQRLNVTSIAPDPVDVVISIIAPLPKSAGGAGGGWLDPVPWPSDTTPIVKITSFVAGTIAVTSATVLGGCEVGKNISVWSTTEKKIYRYTISYCQVVSSFLRIGVVGGFQSDMVGCYISATSENIEGWAATLQAAFASMGPGEKTDNPWILPRAQRFPRESASSRQSLLSWALGKITEGHAEVTYANFDARYESGTTTPKFSPDLPADPQDPPLRLTMGAIAFRCEDV